MQFASTAPITAKRRRKVAQLRVTHWLMLIAVANGTALAGEPEAQGFVDGSTVNVLTRNFFLQSDFRSPNPSNQNYKQEWAQGFIASFASGFTAGTVGFGVDAHSFLGVKLDGGKGHAGTGLLPLDSDGRSESDYSSAGGAVKLRTSQTSLAYGEMLVETPVFDTGDKRLQPEYATGFLLDSHEYANVHAQAGHFTAFKNENATTRRGDFTGYGVSTDTGGISFLGAQLFEDQPWGGALYASELTETWHQYYANLHLKHSGFVLDGNVYHTQDYGKAVAGAIDNTAYSLSGKYTLGAQGFTVAYQKVHGDTPFDFVGGDSIYLANSIKYADFNGPGERSWQLRHDFNFATVGVPGLTLMNRYIKGDNVHTAVVDDGKEWARESELAYVIQSGSLKNLSFKWRNSTMRRDFSNNEFDENRLIVSYPISLL